MHQAVGMTSGRGAVRNVVARGWEPGLGDRYGGGWALVWQESLGDSQPGLTTLDPVQRF